MKKDLIILLGPPACGKGTQAELLANKFNYSSISTGSLLRKEVEKKTELGDEIAKEIDKGNLVSDDLIFNVLKQELNNSNANGIILDGFPRTFKQVEMLEEFLENSQFKLKKVFLINLNFETITKRITGRLTCKKCGTIFNKFFKKPKKDGVCDNCQSNELISRVDDMFMDGVKNRMEIFETNKSEIIPFYEKKSLIFLIDGLKDINIISEEIIQALSN